MQDAGIDLIPSNDFSYYDQVLDAIALVGAVPERYGWSGGQVDLDTYFAMARGRQTDDVDVTAMEMTKWFNTNYHYIVPELGPGHEVLAVDLQAVRRARRGDGGGRDRHGAGADRPGQLPAALQAGRRRRRGLRRARPDRAAGRGLRRGDREARRAGRHLGAVRRALLRRGPHASRSSTRSASPTRSSARSTSARGSWSRPTSTTSATPTACSATCRSRASAWTSSGAVHGDELRPAVHEHGGRHNAQFIAEPGGPRATSGSSPGSSTGATSGSTTWSTRSTLLEGLRDRTAAAGRLDQLLAAPHPDRPRRRAAPTATPTSTTRCAPGWPSRCRRWARWRPSPEGSPTAARRSPTELDANDRAHDSRRDSHRTRNPEVRARVEALTEADARRDSARSPSASRLSSRSSACPPSPRPRSARSPRPTRSGTPGASCARARSSWPTYEERMRAEIDRVIALPGGDRPRRPRPRRAGAQRHGPVLRRADARLRLHPERLGAVIRLALRAPADHLRRRQPRRSR